MLCVVFGAIIAIIALGLGLGNFFVFLDPQPTWLLVLSCAFGLVVAYLATRVGLGLLRDPPTGRKSSGIAMWVGIPIVWLTSVGLNLLISQGQDDVGAWFPAGMFGVLWTAVLVAAGLYMRSRGVHAYFDEATPKL